MIAIKPLMLAVGLSLAASAHAATVDRQTVQAALIEAGQELAPTDNANAHKMICALARDGFGKENTEPMRMLLDSNEFHKPLMVNSNRDDWNVFCAYYTAAYYQGDAKAQDALGKYLDAVVKAVNDNSPATPEAQRKQIRSQLHQQGANYAASLVSPAQ